MRFSGDDVCPISLTPPGDLAHPVGFDSKRAYECDDLIYWIKQSRKHPLTLAPVHGNIADFVHPLVVDGVEEHVLETSRKLKAAGAVWGKMMDGAIRVNMVLFATVLIVFKEWQTASAACSFLHLVFQTLAAYPVNGKYIMWELLIVGFWVLMASQSPALAQGAMLCIRLLMDSAKRASLG